MTPAPIHSDPGQASVHETPAAGGWLGRRDATGKFLAAALVTGALLFAVHPAGALTAIVLELLVTPLAGLRPGGLLRTGWPLLASAAGVFVFGGLLSASGHPLHDAFSYSLRLIAVALPGLIVFTTIDATDLADSLMAHLRVPARFALGVLVAFRLLPALRAEWRMLALARRARGIDAGWNPVARVRLFVSTTFGLLVGAIRRGTRLATAMEARGFDPHGARTTARPTHFGPPDCAVIVAGAALAALSLLVPPLFPTFLR